MPRAAVPTVLQLEREPDNSYDANAIAVLDGTGNRLGYVAREIARSVAPLLDAGDAVTAQLVSRTPGSHGRPGDATIEIRCSRRAL